MKTDRRNFLKAAALTGGASALLPLSSCSLDNKPPKTENTKANKGTDYSKLDKVLKQPVLKRNLFSEPVIIETLELLKDRNNTICRVRSSDGAVGVAIGHPFIAKSSYPMFNLNLKPLFIGKDARDLDLLIYNAAERNVKRQGIPFAFK